MFDRESRNLTDNEVNETLVKRDAIVFALCKRGKVVHKWSQTDFLMRDFNAIQNKQYSRNLSAKVSDAMRRKAEDGWYPNNTPPLGYLPKATLDEAGKERRRGKIVGRDPDERAVRQVIREFELRALGYSFEAIRSQVIADGLIPVTRIKNYHTSTVENRIKNRFYRGYVTWQGKEYPGKHELIIPPEILSAVDWSLHKKNFAKRPIIERNALAGVVDLR